MSTAISLEQVSKIYRSYPSPRAFLRELILRRRGHKKIVALQNISLEVEKGEAFGLVGDNGAGKSTLLKLVVGTSFATSGKVEVLGSVSSLLELGSGFHPEFTGRKNIYLNGALMGLSKKEIRAEESKIIDFSGLDGSIDNPVKTYSSGMYLRLGFAIATGFNPEILVIDEALAVGDQVFQKKCTDRILEFLRRGKTILFCSHNLYQLKSLCDRVIWLDSGIARRLGQAGEVVNAYTNELRARTSVEDGARLTKISPSLDGGFLCEIERVRLLNSLSEECQSFQVGETLAVEIWAGFAGSFKGEPGIAIAVVRNDGVVVYATSTSHDRVALKRIDENRFFARVAFTNPGLLAGRYHLNVCATDQDNVQGYGIVERISTFSIESDVNELDFGVVRLEHRWEHN